MIIGKVFQSELVAIPDRRLTHFLKLIAAAAYKKKQYLAFVCMFKTLHMLSCLLLE